MVALVVEVSVRFHSRSRSGCSCGSRCEVPLCSRLVVVVAPVVEVGVRFPLCRSGGGSSCGG